MSRVLIREVSIIDRRHLSPFDFFDIAAIPDPFRAERRQSFFNIAVEIGIAPWAAGVVNADRFVDFDFAVERFGLRETDLTEGNPEIGEMFAVHVNFL